MPKVKSATTPEVEELPQVVLRRELTRLKKEKKVRVPNLALRIAMILGAEFSEMYETTHDAALCCIDFAQKLQANGIGGRATSRT